MKELPMVQQKWLEQRFDQLFSKIDGQGDQIKSLTLKDQEKSVQIEALTLKAQEKSVQIEALMLKVQEQGIIIKELTAKVATLEARVDLICKQLGNIAPLLRHLLESDNSLLLDPDYKEELRDTLDAMEFYSANDIVTSLPEYEEILGNYKNAHGLASGFGKALSGFYSQVLGYKPRTIKYKAGYHMEIEKPIYDCVSKLYQTGLS